MAEGQDMLKSLRGQMKPRNKQEFQMDRAALEDLKYKLLRPLTPDGEKEGPVGTRGTIGEGARQRPIRLDIDDPDIVEGLNAIVHAVRETDITEKARLTDSEEKARAHEKEVQHLHTQRIDMPLDIHFLEPEVSRIDQIRSWEKSKRFYGHLSFDFVPNGNRRTALNGSEAAMLSEVNAEARKQMAASRSKYASATMSSPQRTRMIQGAKSSFRTALSPRLGTTGMASLSSRK